MDTLVALGAPTLKLDPERLKQKQEKLFDLFIQALLDHNCVAEIDRETRTVAYSLRQRKVVSKVLESLGEHFDLDVKEE